MDVGFASEETTLATCGDTYRPSSCLRSLKSMATCSCPILKSLTCNIDLLTRTASRACGLLIGPWRILLTIRKSRKVGPISRVDGTTS